MSEELTSAEVSEPEQDIQTEIEDLRNGLLPKFHSFLLVYAWLWYVMVTLRHAEPGLHDVPLIAVPLAVLISARLRVRYQAAACWVVLTVLVAVYLLARRMGFEDMGRVLSPVSIVAANALLGTRECALFASLLWLADLVGLRLSTGEIPAREAAEAALPHGLVCVAVLLATQPFETSVSWALNGWSRAREALFQGREQRGRLYRTLRALEEATYRIERMNNELIFARGEAEEARALKARFVSTVSHELRGPLNLILGFSRLITLSPESYKEPLPRAYRADMYTIYRTTQHMVDLLDDVLDLTQIEVQKLPLYREPIDIRRDVVEQVTEVVRPLTERKGIYLRCEGPAELPVLAADKVRLRQALLNLLVNAVRLTTKGGVMVRTAATEREVIVEVEDTGPGISPEDLPRLFQDFSQVRVRSSGDDSPGSGLGLVITKHIVELHGGQIRAEAGREAGMLFTLTLPLPGTTPAVPRVVTTAEGQRQRPAQVCLVVHPDPTVVRLLSRYLEGYRLVGIPNPQDVARLVDELHPHAVIAAPALAPELRPHLSGTAWRVPLVACGLPHDLVGSGAEGVVGILTKPVMPAPLHAMLNRVDRGEEITLLLVDDDPHAVRLLERMIMALPRPYRILKAYNGRHALELMRDAPPDAVFVDLVMPDIDGWQVIARMREDALLREVPIIIVSAMDYAGHEIVLDEEIRLNNYAPIEVARGARCLRALLDELHPQYLATSDAVACEASAPGPRASEAPDRPPKPGQAAAG